MASTHLRIALLAVLVSALTGCGSASSVGPFAHAQPSDVQPSVRMNADDTSGSSFVLFPNAKGTFIYGCGGQSCWWYARGRNQKIGQIWGFTDAEGIGVSPVNGDVFVADAGSSEIKVYPPNNKTLVAVYPDAGQFPVDVAVDRAGNFFVASSGTKAGGLGSVAVYDSSGKIVRTLLDPNAFLGRSVAVDEHDLVIFCFNTRSGQGECDEFPNGRGPGKPIAYGFAYTGGVAFDAAEHFVVIDEINAVADTFNGPTMCGTYTLANSQVPVMVAFDRSSRFLYASTAHYHGVVEYPYTDCGSGVVNPTIVYDDGLGPYTYPNGVAVTPGAGP